MGWKEMVSKTDSEEIAYQMAYDLIEADERPTMNGQPKRPAERQWINLDGPDVFEQIKQRVGL